MIDVKQLAEQAGIETDLWQMGAGSLVYSKHCDGIPRAEFEHFAALVEAAVLERAAQECETPIRVLSLPTEPQYGGDVRHVELRVLEGVAAAIRALKPKEQR